MQPTVTSPFGLVVRPIPLDPIEAAEGHGEVGAESAYDAVAGSATKSDTTILTIASNAPLRRD